MPYMIKMFLVHLEWEISLALRLRFSFFLLHVYIICMLNLVISVIEALFLFIYFILFILAGWPHQLKAVLSGSPEYLERILCIICHKGHVRQGNFPCNAIFLATCNTMALHCTLQGRLPRVTPHIHYR